MSKFGRFAARYENLQRGMLDLAEMRLHEARVVQGNAETKLQQCTAQRGALREALARARAGWEIRQLSDQWSVAGIVEEQAWAEVDAAVAMTSECLAEVHRLHQDAERWATVVDQVADRDRVLQRQLDSTAADEWAVQAHGRPAL